MDEIPSGRRSFISSWIASLHELEKLDFQTIIPGHGRIHKGKAHLRLVRELLQSIVDQVSRARERGLSLEETEASVELANFRARLAGDDELAQRAFDRYVLPIIGRAFREAETR